ncbi:hypothetical protein NKH89_09930 [Mesorhizobium sp. M0923]|uniref:hypothetical protein n=1 Tax=Mesorhizobium sp. M0923 TaxID=2957028 RepID=UPI0033376CF9
MASIGIKTTDITAASGLDSILGGKTVDNIALTRRTSIPSLALQLIASAPFLGALPEFVYASKALLDADTSQPDNKLALIVEDLANAGLYRWDDAGNAWVNVLPFVPGTQIVYATDTGAGTPDAIVASTSLALDASGSQIVCLSVFAANTGSPVTIAFNDGAALTIVSATGQQLKAGDLKAGTVVLGYVSGGNFRLLDDFGTQFLTATNTGGVNVIVATTPTPVPAIDAGALILLPILATNTATPVTVAFNGEAALPLKTNSGNNPVVGGVAAGSVLLGYKSGATFRLLSDQASAAIQAAAELASAAAQGSAAAAAGDAIATAADRAQTASDRLAASASAIAAAGAAGISGTYATHALATAAVAAIAANAFVQVLVDEDHQGHRTMYQKQAGVLVFILDFDFGRFVMLEQFGGVGDGNAATGTGTINDAAVTNAFVALYAAGGGTLFLGRAAYRVTQDFTLPNDGSTDLVCKQPPLRITGHGHHCSGQGSSPTGGSMLMWTGSSGAVGRIVSLGLGTLSVDNVTLLSREGTVPGNGRAFFYTTNTTFKATQTTAWTLKSGTNCDDDFWVAGSAVRVFDNTTGAAFQGYGSSVWECFFNGIRRGLLGRRSFNAERFFNNTFWTRCGSNLAVGSRCAIEIDSGPEVEGQYATGNYIGHNLIEISNAYDYGIILNMAAYTIVVGNQGYDSGAQYLAMVLIQANGKANYVVTGENDNKPYVDNQSTNTNIIIGVVAGEYTNFEGLKAGKHGTANIFGETVFNTSTGGNALKLQPATTQTNNTVVFQSLRSAAEGTNPGEIEFSINYAGGISVNGANAGNFTNGLATGASWSANGKTWTAAGAMKQDSGSGGNNLTLQNAAILINSQAGALQGKWSSGAGSGLGIGIDFGPSGDAALYKGSTAFLGVNVPFKLKSYTAATLPAASVGGAGSLAYVTDANAIVPRTTVAGGGANKVLAMSDGTTWQIAA